MIEPKISLSLFVPGAGMLSQQEAENKPNESYNEQKVSISFIKGKGKHQKEVKKVFTIKTRKQRTVTQHINLCREAYDFMLETPVSLKFIKSWKHLSKNERLRLHLDLIAHDFRAISYSYEVLDD